MPPSKHDGDLILHILDGKVGNMHRVSLGNFNDNKFETTHTWAYDNEKRFRDLSYFGEEVSDPKFRICLTQTVENQTQMWEWMDVHISNIRGVIFETPDEAENRGDR